MSLMSSKVSSSIATSTQNLSRRHLLQTTTSTFIGCSKHADRLEYAVTDKNIPLGFTEHQTLARSVLLYLNPYRHAHISAPSSLTVHRPPQKSARAEKSYRPDSCQNNSPLDRRPYENDQHPPPKYANAVARMLTEVEHAE